MLHSLWTFISYIPPSWFWIQTEKRKKKKHILFTMRNSSQWNRYWNFFWVWKWHRASGVQLSIPVFFFLVIAHAPTHVIKLCMLLISLNLTFSDLTVQRNCGSKDYYGC